MQNERTLHADLILSGITQLISVVLADLDGNKVYQRFQDWTLMDTGVLFTEMGVGENIRETLGE